MKIFKIMSYQITPGPTAELLTGALAVAFQTETGDEYRIYPAEGGIGITVRKVGGPSDQMKVLPRFSNAIDIQ